MRSAGGMQKFVNRYILHGLLRFTKKTRTVQQGAAAVCALVTDEKFKGLFYIKLWLLPLYYY